MNKKKLYLVSREVLATNIKTAMFARGVVYSVSLASDNLQPESRKKFKGFSDKKDV